MGFTMEPDRRTELIAQDPRNADVLFPYLNGQDLNSRPGLLRKSLDDQLPRLARGEGQDLSRSHTPGVREVKPERDARQPQGRTANYWWQYAEQAPGL